MKLVPVKYTKKSAKYLLRCKLCGQKKPSFQMMTDLDAPPFSAYYCLACKEPVFQTGEERDIWWAQFHNK